MTMTALETLLARAPRLEPGHVWLTGAGPGDPGLLTLEAVAGLGQADVVVYDALVAPGILDLAPGAERIYAGKRGGKPSPQQEDITKKLIDLARNGRRVIRLKGGDPYVFGRGGEEALALARAGVPFRVVPGVTSGLSALTAAMIPATMRTINQGIILATGHGAETGPAPDWRALARTGQPIILYMAMKNLDLIVRELLAGGLSGTTPAAIIMQATTEEQRVLVSTLEHIAAEAEAAGIGAPAIVAIGSIVSVRAELLALLEEIRR